MTASLGEKPAAKALMPSSSLSRNTGGTGTPEARAISSTTLSSRRSTGFERVGINAPPAEPLGHAAAAAGELGDLEQAAAADQRQRADGRADRNLPGEVAAGTRSRAAHVRRPDGHRRHDERRQPGCAITESENVTTSHLVLRRASD